MISHHVSPPRRFFTETVTRAHCDVVVQLSRTLRPLPHSRVENVHGVRKCFLDVGASGGPPAYQPKPGNARCYFVGKAMWAKGYTQLLVLLQDQQMSRLIAMAEARNWQTSRTNLGCCKHP